MRRVLIAFAAGCLAAFISLLPFGWQGNRLPAATMVSLLVGLTAAKAVDVLLARGVRPMERRQPESAAVAPPADDRVPVDALEEPAILLDGWRIVAASHGALALFGDRIVGSDLRQSVRYPAIVETVQQSMAGDSNTRNAVAVREFATIGNRPQDLRLRVAEAGETRRLLTFADLSRARLVEQTRADFVANASHELRTPLANIMGFIETLQGPAASDPRSTERFLSIMGREAARMARLIDDLLSLSRIELDRYVRPQTALALQPVIEEAVRAFAPRAEQGERRVRIDIAPGLPPALAERDQISQVLNNLLSNALKYGRDGTEVLVEADVEPQLRGRPMLRISVSDEGDGIDPQHLPRLTERFYRIDTARSRSLGGTGLGLAIVKHIVERHRGRFSIESTPGVGTRVAILLPVAEDGASGVTKA